MPSSRKWRKKGKPENFGKSLMLRCHAANLNKENGIVAIWERGFESLRPDQHKLLIFRYSFDRFAHPPAFYRYNALVDLHGIAQKHW